MRKSNWKTAVLGLLLTVANAAQANLILNGSFEQNPVKKGGWNWFSANSVAGWHGSNIEIWNGLRGVQAAEGNQHIELNSHGGKGGFSIYQPFQTQPGYLYDLSFFYRARNTDKEMFTLEVSSSAGDAVSLLATLDDHITSAWTRFSSSFRAETTHYELRFTAVSPASRTVGNLIDSVAITQRTVSGATSVAEPGTVVLVCLGTLLFLRRRMPS